MALYNPTVPETNKYQNKDVNDLSSEYASTYSQGTTSLIRRILREIIYDSAPQQYADLALLNALPWEQVAGDEWTYPETGWGRSPLLNATISTLIASGASQTFAVSNVSEAAINHIVVLPDNTKATITAISGSNVTITSLTGETLPAVDGSGTPIAAGAYPMSLLSPVEADGIDGMYSYYRMDTTERTNYIQLLARGIRMGRLELMKYAQNGSTRNYLELQRSKMLEQYRTDLSNILWNGTKGEGTIMVNGTAMKTKLTDGIFPIMQAASASNASVTLADTPDALEALALATEYKQYGYRRYLYAAPRVIHHISKQYKSELVRFDNNETLVRLGLTGVHMGSTDIVFVPMKRFEDPGCFPTSFANMAICLDMASIRCKYNIPEAMQRTLDRSKGVLKSYVDDYIEGSIGVEMDNPLSSFYMTVTDLPTVASFA